MSQVPARPVGSHPIGRVAAELRLSLRTLRYWEEVGLIEPGGRGSGGSRLYTDRDIERLAFVRAMKPIDFSLDELKDLLATYDALENGPRNQRILDNAAAYAERIRDRCEVLESRIVDARAASDELDSLVQGVPALERPSLRPGAIRKDGHGPVL